LTSIEGILDRLAAKMRLEEVKQALSHEIDAISAAKYRHPDHLREPPTLFEFFVACVLVSRRSF
jgi:hypothetical protein